MVNPGGVGRPALVISARPAPLPPSRSFIPPLPSGSPPPHAYMYRLAATWVLAVSTMGSLSPWMREAVASRAAHGARATKSHDVTAIVQASAPMLRVREARQAGTAVPEADVPSAPAHGTLGPAAVEGGTAVALYLALGRPAGLESAIPAGRIVVRAQGLVVLDLRWRSPRPDFEILPSEAR